QGRHQRLPDCRGNRGQAPIRSGRRRAPARLPRGELHPDGASLVRQQVKQLLERMRLSSKWTSHKAEEVVKYIEVDAPMLWERPKVEVVNVLNGLLVVSTRVLS